MDVRRCKRKRIQEDKRKRKFKRKKTKEDKKKIKTVLNYQYQRTDVSLKVFEWFSLSRRTNDEELKSDWGHSSKRFVLFYYFLFRHTVVPDDDTLVIGSQ